MNSERTFSWEEIKRVNQNRRFTITTQFKSKMKTAVKKLEGFIYEEHLVKGTNRAEVSGVNKEVNSSLQSMLYALIFAIVLVYMILASQFESLKLPFIIMFVAPMGIIGVAFGLFSTGTSISVMSTLGMVILAGIIVNDAILLVDYTNKLRKAGKVIRQPVTPGPENEKEVIIRSGLEVNDKVLLSEPEQFEQDSVSTQDLDL